MNDSLTKQFMYKGQAFTLERASMGHLYKVGTYSCPTVPAGDSYTAVSCQECAVYIADTSGCLNRLRKIYNQSLVLEKWNDLRD